MKRAGLMRWLPPVAAFALFGASVFMIINQREGIRTQEEQRQRTREEAIVLRDEWRNLQLEYATLTGYHHLHQRAAQLGMVSPRPGKETFLYLSAEAQGE